MCTFILFTITTKISFVTRDCHITKIIKISLLQATSINAQIVNLNEVPTVFKEYPSLLLHKTSCISNLQDMKGDRFTSLNVSSTLRLG